MLFKATQFVVFVPAALGNQYILSLSSPFSDKETEAQRGQIFGNLSRSLLCWLGTYSEDPPVGCCPSPPSLRASALWWCWG